MQSENSSNIQLKDFDYLLPEKAIALYPPSERGGSRLLSLNRETGQIKDSMYSNLASFLKEGDVLVINNTRVIPARLSALTDQGAERELLLLEKHGQGDDHHSSQVMYRGKIRAGQQLMVGETAVTVDEVFSNGTARISSNKDLWALAEESGEVPLPPYMNREEEADDRERYQTEFAKNKGSVAAPTASLNLTSSLLQELKDMGVIVAELTLHVGLGTFMPIRVDDVTKHKMHQEYFEIPPETVSIIRSAKSEGRRIVAVGTTVTRTLEYVADILAPQDGSVKNNTAEGDPANNDSVHDDSIKADSVNNDSVGNGSIVSDSISILPDGRITGEADIFIYPGYQFKIVEGLLTNFHAPHSTVLMMASAFAGWSNLESAYLHALSQDYMFLSYGDSMLIA